MSASKTRRWPFFQWVLLLGLIYFVLKNAMRLYGALKAWKLLDALHDQPGPLYIAITGGIFMLVFAVAAAGLVGWSNSTGRGGWGLTAVRTAAVLYTAWYWVDRLLISQGAERMTGWAFSLGASAVLLGLVFSATAVLAELRRD